MSVNAPTTDTERLSMEETTSDRVVCVTGRSKTAAPSKAMKDAYLGLFVLLQFDGAALVGAQEITVSCILLLQYCAADRNSFVRRWIRQGAAEQASCVCDGQVRKICSSERIVGSQHTTIGECLRQIPIVEDQ